MKNFIIKVVWTIEKTVVAMCVMTAFGLVSGDNFTLDSFRKIMIFSICVGAVIGISRLLFDVERLNTKVSYVIHFIIGYASFNILEGVVFYGKFLPQAPAIGYLYKLAAFFVIYLIIAAVEVYNQKSDIKKMSERIREIKEV